MKNHKQLLRFCSYITLALYALLVPQLSMAQSQMQSLDSTIRYVELAADTDGRFESFVIASDQNVYGRWQHSATLQWSDWSILLQGKFTVLRTLNVAGRLFLFGLDNGVLVVRGQVSPGGGWSSNIFRSGSGLRNFAVAVNGNGTVQVAALNAAGKVMLLDSKTSAPETGKDWNAWELFGTSRFLTEIALSLDGTGRMTLVALGPASGEVAQQITTPDKGWRQWPSLVVFGTVDFQTNVMHQVSLCLGRGDTLWLLGIDNGGNLAGMSLHSSTTGGSSGSPPPLGNWSKPRTLIAVPLFAAAAMVAKADPSGAIEVAALHSQVAAAHLVQNPDGSWPSNWNYLPFENVVPINYGQISLGINPLGITEIIIQESTHGKVFAMSKAPTAKWDGQAWIALGRIPGSVEPDIQFEALLCLEALPNLPLPPEVIRTDIETLVPDRVLDTLQQTQLTSGYLNTNASSRCVNGHEVFGVWLNNEVWPGYFGQRSQLPDATEIIYRIPAATLKSFIGTALRSVFAAQGAISSYSFALSAPNQIVVKASGKAKGVSFNAKAVATYGVDIAGANPTFLPTCNATLIVERPALLTALAALFPPFSGYVLQSGDSLTQDYVNKYLADAQTLCLLEKAVLSDEFIPPSNPSVGVNCEDNHQGTTVQSVKLRFDKLTISDSKGLVATSGLGPSAISVGPATPQAQLLELTDTYTPSLKQLSMNFWMINIRALQPPLTVTWTPSGPSIGSLPTRCWVDTQLLDGCLPSTETFYRVQPAEHVPFLYQLGDMRATVQDSFGQCFSISTPVNSTVWNLGDL